MRSCSVCYAYDMKRRTITQCMECFKAFCPTHMQSTELCWACARNKMIHIDTPIMRVCAICQEEREMNVEKSLTYHTVLCYNCASEVDALYVIYAENLIKEVK